MTWFKRLFARKAHDDLALRQHLASLGPAIGETSGPPTLYIRFRDRDVDRISSWIIPRIGETLEIGFEEFYVVEDVVYRGHLRVIEIHVRRA